MKKLGIGLTLIVLLAVVAIAYAQGPGWWGMGPGMMGRGPGGCYCPYCGQWMGRGMMGGYGMGPGMMGPGYGQQYPQQYQQTQKPLEEKDAKEIVENYLRNMRNPNLKLGNMKDAGSAFEADIVTKDNSLVDKVLIDKSTGWMRSAY
jgi:hypothetical protein